MKFRLLAASTAAALMAMGGAFAQSSRSPADSPSTTTGPGTSGPAAGATSTPSACVGMTGAERDRCMREHGASAGGTTTTPATPGTPGAPSPGQAPGATSSGGLSTGVGDSGGGGSGSGGGGGAGGGGGGGGGGR